MRDTDYLELEYSAYQAAKSRRNKTRNERKRKAHRRVTLSIFVALAVLAALAARDAVFGVGGDSLTPEAPKAEETPNNAAVEETAQGEASADAEVEPEAEPENILAGLPMIDNVRMTHYCICEACCGKTPDHPAYGITASGREAVPYLSVAVDPDVIPLGSTVYVDYGNGDIREYRADDTGGAINGSRIDLCVTDHREALNLGVKTVAVYWDEEGA